ncbi:hypothetical protein BU26DRAFT_84339 [Trematosphaeria pertusa]|uniref:Uncharacterized protein n=1 Tax=Trematosphaeria pertusa TaxID=390896 RepID=A0A6A6I3V9_9PLEO|nr:uncharacterized protein BU26DRAFT_84339 [Trematosphaeria pertusa]KAF2244688.1 hypothetical protein BU26DRAFT_84339 [Trematosphaeria pertusa]
MGVYSLLGVWSTHGPTLLGRGRPKASGEVARGERAYIFLLICRAFAHKGVEGPTTWYLGRVNQYCRIHAACFHKRVGSLGDMTAPTSSRRTLFFRWDLDEGTEYRPRFLLNQSYACHRSFRLVEFHHRPFQHAWDFAADTYGFTSPMEAVL